MLVRVLLFITAVILQLTACGGSEEPASAPAIAVTALTIVPGDVPVTTIFVAQTQSSQAVNIQARVSGFLEKRVYTEGTKGAYPGVERAFTPDGPDVLDGGEGA